MTTKIRFTEDLRVAVVDVDGQMACVSPSCSCHCNRVGILVRNTDILMGTHETVIMTLFDTAEYKATHRDVVDLRKLKWKNITSVPKKVIDALKSSKGVVYNVHSRISCVCSEFIELLKADTPFKPMTNRIRRCGRDVLSVGMDMVWGNDWVICTKYECKKCASYRGEEVEQTTYLDTEGGSLWKPRIMGQAVYDAIHGVRIDIRDLSYGIFAPMKYGSVSDRLRRIGII